jgi:hypothetical protein
VRVRRLVLLAVGVLAATPARGHDRTVSYSTWDIQGAHARVTARVAALDASRLPWAADPSDFERRFGRYLGEQLTLRADGTTCTVSAGPTRLTTTPDQLSYTWELTCPTARTLEITSGLLLDVAPSHLHFARVRLGPHTTAERVLSEGDRVWALGDADTRTTVGSSLADFLLLGVEHILTGYDHLVFLLALLLLGGTLRDVVRIVTGFTLAHSITLALAAFDVLRPERAPIEALIGLSIALVAAENLWLAGGRRPGVRWSISAVLLALALAAWRGVGAVPALTLVGLAVFAACYFGLVARVARPAPLRAAVAFVFGLIHGFGFAGVLLEAELPRERIATALFGFNAGVELGQVAAVLALWPVLQLTWRYRDGVLHRGVVEYGSAAILTVGMFWYVSRAYGG